MDEKVSDHLPIQLKVFKPHQGRRDKTRRRFENMWTLHGGCEEIISHAWNTEAGPGATAACLAKINQCMDDLIVWNGREFGHIQKQIKQCTEKLKMAQDISVRSVLLDQIDELRQKEEVMWCQRARVDYLRYGDKNSAWFHGRATQRHRTNAIMGLQGPDGVIYREHHDL